MLETLVQSIRTIYAVFDQLELSVTALILATIVFAIAFLFAVREAAGWFFKVDDIKRDVRKLHGVVTSLEAEVRLLQALLAQNRSHSLPNEKSTPAMAHADPSAMSVSPIATTSLAPKQPVFPINH